MERTHSAASNVVAMNRTSIWTAVLALCGVALLCVAWGCHVSARSAEELGGDWIAQRSDNICGLDDPGLLSNPAVVTYDSLLERTPEVQRIHREQIDERSALGIQLRQKAADRVRDACECVRVAQSYCSVWRQIRHRDGRTIPDATAAVGDILQPPK